MKRLRLFILVLGMSLLCACSASDSTEADMPSGSGDTWSQASGDAAQTEQKDAPESREPERIGPETSAVSDRNEMGEGSTPSASLQAPGENAPARQQEDDSRPETHSRAPAVSPESVQDGTGRPAGEAEASAEAPATEMEEPVTEAVEEAPAAETEEPVTEPVEESPAATQPPAPEATALEEPVQQMLEPEEPKSIYDYAFDADAIRSELIAIGQSMGLTHITEDYGIPCTPDTCSWAVPVTASESFQGDNLKRALQDYVTSMPSVIASYGGAQVSSFTIYVQDNGGGSYTFYFLY